MFWLKPIKFSSFNLNYNCYNVLDLQEQVKKVFCLKKISDFSLHEWIDLVISKKIANCKFLKFFSITKPFFLTVGQNNFHNKIPRIGIRVWWNYLMNSVFINFSHFNNMYNVHIVVHGNLALRFKPVVWKSIILNCHLLNCGTENRKSPTVLRDATLYIRYRPRFFWSSWASNHVCIYGI